MTTRQELGYAMLMLAFYTALMLAAALSIVTIANAAPAPKAPPKHFKGWWGFVGSLRPDIQDEHTLYNIPGTDNSDPEFELYWDKADDKNCSMRHVWGYPYDARTHKANKQYVYRGRAVGSWCAPGHPTEYLTGVAIEPTPGRPGSGTILIPYGVMRLAVIAAYAPVTPGGTPVGFLFGDECYKGDGITTHGYCPSQQCEIKADPIYHTSCPYINYLNSFCRRGFGHNPKGCFCEFEVGSFGSQTCFHIATTTAGEFFPWPTGLPATLNIP